MAADLFPGAPLQTASGPTVSRGALGVVVRDTVDGDFYGVTVRQLVRPDQMVLLGGAAKKPVGKLTGKFDDEIEALGGPLPVSELLGFIEISRNLSIEDANPQFAKSIVATAPIQQAIEEELLLLRANGATVPVEIVSVGLTFDLQDDDGSMTTFRGGVEISGREEGHPHATAGDGGAPVVTTSGRLVGVVVAVGDETSVVAPLDTVVRDAAVELFIREKHKKSPAAVSPQTLKANANRVGGRLAGVNIPANKRVVIALQYIHGIGATSAKAICAKVGVADHVRVNQLTDEKFYEIREVISNNYTVEGDLRRETSMNIKRLMDLNCYRGSRHRKGLPVRGQRTHTNARTRKGPAKPIQVRK